MASSPSRLPPILHPDDRLYKRFFLRSRDFILLDGSRRMLPDDSTCRAISRGLIRANLRLAVAKVLLPSDAHGEGEFTEQFPAGSVHPDKISAGRQAAGERG
jgi:hypothetical protein